MKKFFTLICALVATVAASAATIGDVMVCKHSLVINFSEVTNAGTAKPGKGNLFASGFALDVTGGSVATNKGESDPSTYEDNGFNNAKYADCGNVKNTFRLKNGQDVIAMKVTAGSKLHFFGQVHASRYPKITDTAPSGNNMQGTVLPLNVNTTSTDGYSNWVADDDRTIYIGSEGGDWYLGYIIVEANEVPGTPSVTVSGQDYDEVNALYYRDVTCKTVTMDAEGMEMGTICTYTTDGSAPTAASPIYTEPIRCYANQTVKFQAYMDFGDGIVYDETQKAVGADNEAIVEFSFDAPTLDANGGDVTIESSYTTAKNVYTINGGEEVSGSNFTLNESATVTAWSVIENGKYATFTTKSVTKDVYVLEPVTEQTTIVVTAGDVVLDEEATATSTTGPVYKVENGAISADKTNFFVKNLTFGVVKEAEYQIDGKEAYIQMSNTTIDFELADNALVTVVCTKNACKNIDSETVADRACKVQVDGKQYGSDDIKEKYDIVDAEGQTIETLEGNIVKFDLEAGHHQFQKYSGTGNIKIASITIEPGVTATQGVVAKEEKVAAVAKYATAKGIEIKANGATYNVAGQMK